MCGLACLIHTVTKGACFPRKNREEINKERGVVQQGKLTPHLLLGLTEAQEQQVLLGQSPRCSQHHHCAVYVSDLCFQEFECGRWRAAGGQLECSWRAGGRQVEGRWRDGSAVKSTDCSSRGPRFNSQHPHSSSHLSVTAVLRDLIPSRR